LEPIPVNPDAGDAIGDSDAGQFAAVKEPKPADHGDRLAINGRWNINRASGISWIADDGDTSPVVDIIEKSERRRRQSGRHAAQGHEDGAENAGRRRHAGGAEVDRRGFTLRGKRLKKNRFHSHIPRFCSINFPRHIPCLFSGTT